MSFEKKFVTGEVLQQVAQGVRDKIKGEIVDNLESTDINKPLSANQGKILDEKIATETSKNLELLKGNSGIKDVFYIQDVGIKEIGKGYIDKVTKELYICLVENGDTDIKLGKFELATNIENRFRLMRLEEKLGVYQPVYGIKELKVSRDENNSSPSLTYTQK